MTDNSIAAGVPWWELTRPIAPRSNNPFFEIANP